MVIINWHLHTIQVENGVDLHNDSDRDKIISKVNKCYNWICLKLNDTYRLNK